MIKSSSPSEAAQKSPMHTVESSKFGWNTGVSMRHCGARLTILTRRMMGDFERVRRWAETDDVLQNALVRLLKVLGSVKPQTSRDFLALASLQIRRERRHATSDNSPRRSRAVCPGR